MYEFLLLAVLLAGVCLFVLSIFYFLVFLFLYIFLEKKNLLSNSNKPYGLDLELDTRHHEKTIMFQVYWIFNIFDYGSANTCPFFFTKYHPEKISLFKAKIISSFCHRDVWTSSLCNNRKKKKKLLIVLRILSVFSFCPVVFLLQQIDVNPTLTWRRAKCLSNWLKIRINWIWLGLFKQQKIMRNVGTFHIWNFSFFLFWII